MNGDPRYTLEKWYSYTVGNGNGSVVGAFASLVISRLYKDRIHLKIEEVSESVRNYCKAS